MQVVCPLRGRELDGEGGEHLVGALLVSGHGQGTQVLEVEEDVALLLVVADRDKGGVRGTGGDRGLADVGNVLDGQRPDRLIGRARPWRGKRRGLGEVEVELGRGEAAGAHHRERVVGVDAVLGQQAQGTVHALHRQRVGDGADVLLENGRAACGQRKTLTWPAQPLLVPTSAGEQGQDASGEDRPDSVAGANHPGVGVVRARGGLLGLMGRAQVDGSRCGQLVRRLGVRAGLFVTRSWGAEGGASVGRLGGDRTEVGAVVLDRAGAGLTGGCLVRGGDGCGLGVHRDLQRPAGADQVRVGEAVAVGLDDVVAGLDDLGEAGPLVEVLLGQVPQGVPRFDGDGLVLRRSVHVGWGFVDGQPQLPAGLEESGAVAQDVAVEVVDLPPPVAVAEFCLRDRPQRLPALDRVRPCRWGGRLCDLGGRRRRRGGQRRRRGGSGGRGRGKVDGGLGGCGRGCPGTHRKGDEEHRRRGHQPPGGTLRQGQAGEPGCADTADPRRGLHEDAQRQEGPRGPGGGLHQPQQQGPVVG